MLLSGSRGFLSSESNFDGQVVRRRRNSKEPHAHRQFAAVNISFTRPLRLWSSDVGLIRSTTPELTVGYIVLSQLL